MSYSRAVQKVVKNALANMREIESKKESTRKNPNITRYGEKYVEELINELDAEKDGIRSAAFKEVSILSESYRGTLEEKYMPKAEEINADAELLKSGILLSGAELEKVFDRNEGNNTMQRLISEYASRNELKINRVYEGAKKDLETIEDMQRYTRDMFDRPEYENELDKMYFGVANE